MDLLPLLPEYYLNARSLLELPLPELHIGEHRTETTSYAPTSTRYFRGTLKKWDTFNKEVMSFYTNPRTNTELERCDYAPIYMDPKVEKLNSKAMTSERLQVGAEISLSGRFFWNALAPVIHSIETLTSEEHGISEHPGFLPKQLTFGDSWIIHKKRRLAKLQPDVVLKVQIQDEQNIRLVGELKFCVTVGLGTLVADAEDDDGKSPKFRAILGQIVQYMLSHEMLYGFISNYNETVFLKLGHCTKDGVTEPCVFYSDIVEYDDAFSEADSQISLRIALFYLAYKTSSPQEADWQMPGEFSGLMKDWISQSPAKLPDAPVTYEEANNHHRGLDLITPQKQLIKGDGIGAPILTPGLTLPRDARVRFVEDQSEHFSATPSKPPKGQFPTYTFIDTPSPASDTSPLWPKPSGQSFTQRLRSQKEGVNAAQADSESDITHKLASMHLDTESGSSD